MTREVFEVDVFAVIAVTDAMLPLLRRSPAGRIVNVTSSLGSLGLMTTPGTHQVNLPASTAYRPAKTALNALTVNYAQELRDAGILVNAADPGGCATDFTLHVTSRDFTRLHVTSPRGSGARAPVRRHRARRSRCGWPRWATTGRRAGASTTTVRCPW
ncbi:SDR family NAD(P)-dependent oxidoreductase [Actinomadura sp. DC4]|uniref:SDR family NAD(P)-dependent oxidoreductase n=1 Tax=Actinomadura sp. DC4 TaxID=3055069 RepID=UPI0025B13D17|nr:SDR family NAD(P)-dependent oxidoreductase [Actinomadura sp. DC4]MDN3351825.1 SDR family NAD(P)-dependent oxidoreductase [Actinomadura sp. DC4]